jgi:hypothetical protein
MLNLRVIGVSYQWIGLMRGKPRKVAWGLESGHMLGFTTLATKRWIMTGVAQE